MIANRWNWFGRLYCLFGFHEIGGWEYMGNMRDRRCCRFKCNHTEGQLLNDIHTNESEGQDD